MFKGYIKINRNHIPQYLHFRCGKTHLNYSLRNLGKIFNLQKQSMKTEINLDGKDCNNYKD